MDESTVKEASQTAQRLAAHIQDRTLRAGAFSVLFARLLDSAGLPSGFAPRNPRFTPGDKHTGRTVKAGPIQRIRELISEGFFDTPRSLKGTMEELETRGFGYDSATVGKCLQRLVRDRLLRRKRGKEGKREIYVYTRW